MTVSGVGVGSVKVIMMVSGVEVVGVKVRMMVSGYCTMCSNCSV